MSIKSSRVNVCHVGGIIGAHDKSEMVSVVMAALREIALVCEVCLAAEQVRPLAAPVDAIPLEISDVDSKWWRLASPVTHNVGSRPFASN